MEGTEGLTDIFNSTRYLIFYDDNSINLAFGKNESLLLVLIKKEKS